MATSVWKSVTGTCAECGEVTRAAQAHVARVMCERDDARFDRDDAIAAAATARDQLLERTNERNMAQANGEDRERLRAALVALVSRRPDHGGQHDDCEWCQAVRVLEGRR